MRCRSSVKPVAAAMSRTLSPVCTSISVAAESRRAARCAYGARAGLGPEPPPPRLVGQPDLGRHRGQVEGLGEVALEELDRPREPTGVGDGTASARVLDELARLEQGCEQVERLGVARVEGGGSRPVERGEAGGPPAHRQAVHERVVGGEGAGAAGKVEDRAVEHDEVLVPAAGVGAVPVRVARMDDDERACADGLVVARVAVATGAGREEGEAPRRVPSGRSRRQPAPCGDAGRDEDPAEASGCRRAARSSGVDAVSLTSTSNQNVPLSTTTVRGARQTSLVCFTHPTTAPVVDDPRRTVRTMPTDTLPELTTAYPVGDEQVAAYRADGFLRLSGLADAGEAAAYRGPIAAAVERLSTETRPLAERDSYGMAFLQVMNLWRHDESVARFVMASRFADVAARLLGVPRVRLYHDQALFKEPGGGYTPWHQDAMYWPLDGARCLTMWMPLVDITPAHGGLAFATGSHVDGPLSDIGISDASEEHFDRLVAERGLVVDEPVAMRAGDASFHSGLDGAQGARQLLGADARGHDGHLVRRRAPRARAGQPGAGERPRHLAARPRPG